MSKEDQILDLLKKMKTDMETMKTDIEHLKKGREYQPSQEESQVDQKKLFHQLSKILSDEEKERFGKFMDAEESRKAAIYGC